VPRLEVDRDGPLALAAPLVHVPRRVVEHAQHGDEPVGLAARAAYVGPLGARVVHVEPDPARALGDARAVVDGVEDAVDRICVGEMVVWLNPLPRGGSRARLSRVLNVWFLV